MSSPAVSGAARAARREINVNPASACTTAGSRLDSRHRWERPGRDAGGCRVGGGLRRMAHQANRAESEALAPRRRRASRSRYDCNSRARACGRAAVAGAKRSGRTWRAYAGRSAPICQAGRRTSRSCQSCCKAARWVSARCRARCPALRATHTRRPLPWHFDARPVRIGSAQIGEEHVAEEHHQDREHNLGVRQGRDIAVAGRRHRGRRPVH